MTDELPPEAGLDLRLAKALAHPVRQQLLMAYHQAVTSPSELAVKLGRPLNEVAYHTKRLVEMECVELIRTERGPGVKHFYRATVRAEIEDADWRRLPRGLRRTLAAPTLSQVVKEARLAASRGVLDADDAHFSRVPLELDDAGWGELSELLADVVERAQELSRDSARRRRSGTVMRPSVLGMFHFPRS
jgi:Helix-turn-helix domain